MNRTQLDATASASGTFAYTTPAGTVLSVGLNQTLNTTFTPTDIANYTTASATASINILTPTQKINQMITFVQGLAISGEIKDNLSIELIAILNDAEKIKIWRIH